MIFLSIVFGNRPTILGIGAESVAAAVAGIPENAVSSTGLGSGDGVFAVPGGVPVGMEYIGSVLVAVGKDIRHIITDGMVAGTTGGIHEYHKFRGKVDL